MHIFCVLRNQSTDNRKENSTIWKVRTVITLYVVKQLLTPIFFSCRGKDHETYCSSKLDFQQQGKTKASWNLIMYHMVFRSRSARTKTEETNLAI